MTGALDLFQEHAERTRAFSDALMRIHCRDTGRFEGDLRETLAPLVPLMSAWNAEILFALWFNGPLRFNRLMGLLGGVSARVLTDKLRSLQEEGLVQHKEHADHAVYEATPDGLEVARLLHPLLFFLRNRGALQVEAGAHLNSHKEGPGPLPS